VTLAEDTERLTATATDGNSSQQTHAATASRARTQAGLPLEAKRKTGKRTVNPNEVPGATRGGALFFGGASAAGLKLESEEALLVSRWEARG
jgi:hypothetical protein